MKGREIAKKLKISTSALKHYESWDIIPPVEREENGYRYYQQEHEDYFRCILALNSGFGMNVVREVMPLIMKGDHVQGFWLINKAQVELREQRLAAQRLLEMLESEKVVPMEKISKTQDFFSIGKLAKETNIPASTIRHWEKEGLIKPIRHKESGFRMYTYFDLQKILVINTLQKAVYSIDTVRSILTGYETNNIHHTIIIAQKAMKHIDAILLEQMRGIAALHGLLEVIQKKNNREM